MADPLSDLLGGVFGLFGGGAERERANQLVQSGQSALAGANPDIAIQTLGPSAFENLSVDPSTREAMMSALGNYKDIISNGGLNAEDRANLAEIQNQQAGQTNAALQGLQESAARRGQAASPLAAQRAAVSSGANTAAMQGLGAAAQGEANRRAALGNYAQLAGGIHAQDYGEAANRAAQQDLVNRLNWQNRQSQMQQNFQNRLGLAGGYGNLSSVQQGNAAQATGAYGAAGRGIGSAGGSILSAFGGDGGGL